MGKPSRATQTKRTRERDQKERKDDKKAKRDFRQIERAEKIAGLEEGVDPDLIGIFPGPQNIPEADEDDERGV